MGEPLSVLLVEDSPDDATLLLCALTRAGYEPAWTRVDSSEGMTQALETRSFDLVLSDHGMPCFSATEALAVMRKRGLDVPFIIVSGTMGEDAAVTAMKAGAHDYVPKGNLKRLGAAIQRELKDAVVRRAQRHAEERARHLAYHDSLTGLGNRAHLKEQLNESLAAAQTANESVALLAVKLDSLKDANNTLGHRIGDLILTDVALRLQRLVGDARVFRTGSDSFALLLSSADADAAIGAARRVLATLEEPHRTEVLEIDLAASIGIALYPGHAEDGDLLIQRADVALAQAQRDQSDIELYNHSRDPYDPQRLSMMAELRRAIESNQLVLHYQPQVRFRTQEAVRVEALVRWMHPKLGMVPPDRFIPLAEQSGLVHSLTRWVIKEALRQAHLWQRQGLSLGVSVNLSARNVHDADLREHILRMLGTWGMKASNLTVEVTESAIMTDVRGAQTLLEALQEAGVHIAIDDFGTGYSSLSLLRKLPISEIKIDKSFVLGMTRHEEDAAIVRSTIDLSHNLRMEVVAEGVEDQAMWDTLEGLGCDIAQGYLKSRPLAADALLEWSRRNAPPLAHASSR